MKRHRFSVSSPRSSLKKIRRFSKHIHHAVIILRRLAVDGQIGVSWPRRRHSVRSHTKRCNTDIAQRFSSGSHRGQPGEQFIHVSLSFLGVFSPPSVVNKRPRLMVLYTAALSNAHPGNECHSTHHFGAKPLAFSTVLLRGLACVPVAHPVTLESCG